MDFQIVSTNASDHEIRVELRYYTAPPKGTNIANYPPDPTLLAHTIIFPKNKTTADQPSVDALDGVIDTLFSGVFPIPINGQNPTAFNFRYPLDRQVKVTLIGKEPKENKSKRRDRLNLAGRLVQEKWDKKVTESSVSKYPMSTGRAWVFSILEDIIEDIMKGKKGVTILQINTLSTRGSNCNLPKGKAMFSNAAGDAIRPMVLDENPKMTTMIHELGHCLFLNHTFQSARMHDAQEFSQSPKPTNGAVMHVTPSTQNDLSSIDGFDMIRIRGWSLYKTNNSGNVLPAPTAPRIKGTTQPTNGTILVVPNANRSHDITYTPNLDWTGEDGFNLILDDGAGSPEIIVPIRILVEEDRTVHGTGVTTARLSWIKAIKNKPITFDPFDTNQPGNEKGYIHLRGIRTIWKAGMANKDPNGDPPPPFAKSWLDCTGGNETPPII